MIKEKYCKDTTRRLEMKVNTDSGQGHSGEHIIEATVKPLSWTHTTTILLHLQYNVNVALTNNACVPRLSFFFFLLFFGAREECGQLILSQ